MALPLSIFYLTLISLILTHSLSLSPDIDLLLNKIKPSLEGKTEKNLILSSWNLSNPLCNWQGLKWSSSSCSSSSILDKNLKVLSIQLPSANLSGSLPKELSSLSSLSLLFLSFNFLSGDSPLELGFSQSLSKIDLRNNSLSGSLPVSFWNLCGGNIVSFDVSSNNLSGTLPEPALPNASCDSFVSLNLGRNSFSGTFPVFITKFSSLKELDLSSNGFSGPVPQSIGGLKLEKLNFSYNNFSGGLPVTKFGVEAFEGNSYLCGGPLKGCNIKSNGISSGAIAGLVIGLMTGAVVIASLLIGYTQGRRRKNKPEDEEEDFDDLEENGEGDEGKLVLFQGGEHLSLEDVLNATGQVMEKTSYGTVYKAKLADGSSIALRLLREGSCKDKSLCLPVIKLLGRIRHENLIPLRAFYQGKRGEKLLIYDFQPNKTLHDLLHESRVGKPALNWARRHKIALCIARGLAYLHTGLETPVTHGNVRSKNILVDDFFVARITDFGLDKLMIPVVADELVTHAKSDGYKAPELQSMKKSNSRTDVYAFGILLLEILLGKKPGKNGRNSEFVDLPSLVKVAVLEETTMEVFDVEILKATRSPMEDGLVQALKLAMGCCAPVAMVRPTMDEVVKQLEENRPRNRSALYSPTETRSGSITPF